MADQDVDVGAVLAALEVQRETLLTELTATEDDNRRDEILKTLASVDEQKQHLREEHEQLPD